MNYVAIGDVHGRRDLLDELLRRIESNYPYHILLFLGDYVDRGPNSFGVICTIKRLCDEGRAVAVMGNHEAMMLDFVADGATDSAHSWLFNGGYATMRSYGPVCGGSRAAFLKNFSGSGHLDWMKSLPLYHETEEIFASHAPISKADGSAGKFRENPFALYWTYQPVAMLSMEAEGAYNHGKLALCGHIHRLQENVLTPRIYPHIVYADTGCGCADWGPLTGVVVEDGKYVDYIQVSPNEI